MTPRQVCAVLWLLLAICALIGGAAEEGQMVLVAWVGAIVMLLVTVILVRPKTEERLARPLPYRVVSGLLLALALTGGVLALVPDASEASQAYGVFFALIAVVVYRAVIARGASTAMRTLALAMFLFLPFVVVANIGCKCGRYSEPEHWSAGASSLVLQVFLFALPVLVACALLAFAPRTDELPEARVL